jgi:2-oxoisovalerate dehydrogenase E1 component beta subunit
VTEKNLITAIRDTLRDEMSADDRIVLLGEDVGARGGVFKASEGFLETFGEQRVIDTPLAEAGIVGVAIGIHGALYHSQSIEAFYAHVPGLKVVMPSTPADAAGLLRSAIHDPDPVLFLEHKKCYRSISGQVPEGSVRIPIGPADVKRPGRDLTVVTYGYEVHRCLEAAERLAHDDGVEVEVIDVRSLAPLDTDTILDSVRRTSRAMVVYEDNRTYGAGAEIAATIAEEAMFDLDAAIVRIGGPDIPAMPYAASLEHFFVEPQPDHLYRAMRDLARF